MNSDSQALTAAFHARQFKLLGCVSQEEFDAMRERAERAEGYIEAIWRKDLLPTPLGDALFDQLVKKKSPAPNEMPHC